MSIQGAFTYALIGDGPTDRALAPIVRWTLRRAAPALELVDPPAFIPRRHRPIRDAIDEALQLRPDLVFVHRDAEGASYEERRREIPDEPGVVPVVPIRMTEAWLLLEEGAIRAASGNPNGRSKLDLPRTSRLEQVQDPKQVLRELLVLASGRTGRRRMRFEPGHPAHERVAELVTTFEPLLRLHAFAAFWQELLRALGAVGVLPAP